MGSWIRLLSLKGKLSQILPEVNLEVADTVEAAENMSVRVDWIDKVLEEREGPHKSSFILQIS